MPHAVSGPHPFEPTRRNGTALAGRVLVDHGSAQHDRERRDSGVGMDSEERFGPRHDFRVIQEYEGLDQLADIGRADQAIDRAVAAAAGGLHDAAGRGVGGGEERSRRGPFFFSKKFPTKKKSPPAPSFKPYIFIKRIS